MEKEQIIMVGAVEAPVEDEKYNKWYNETHGPMLLKYKGLLEIKRYKLVTETPGQPKYFVIMIFADKKALDGYNNSPERMAAQEEVKKSWPDGPAKVTFGGRYELIKDLKK
ncbi:MAG TPA: EthD family reductase [Dehalococcoidales bacterium]|nr:EthD family reductase [Dehalococcoidales bacterium]